MSIEAKVNSLLWYEMQLLRLDIINALDHADKTATGLTAESIQIVTSNNSMQLQAPSHLLTLEEGRGPARNSNSDKQQFIENLKAWILAKGISYKDENDLQRLAGFFRWYINKFGTKQYRQGKREEIVTDTIERFKKSVNGKLTDLYTAELGKFTVG